MTDRRAIVCAGALTMLGAAMAAFGQRSTKAARVGFLTPGHNSRELPFWQGMRDLGYAEGKNMVVERRSAEGDLARLPPLAVEIVGSRPDVIVAIVSSSAIAARHATSTIPIVMVGVADPVASGLVGNLARPGGNVTGTASLSTAAVGKQFELIRQFLPGAARVATLWDPANAVFQQLMLGEALSAASRLRIVVRIVEVGTREDLDRAFAVLGSERPDAVLVFQDPLFVANAGRIAELALASRLPVFSGARPLVEAGILATYGTDLAVVARRSAAYVDKILKGAKAGDLPVELPTKFETVVNEKTARALGIAIPASLRARADEVIR